MWNLVLLYLSIISLLIIAGASAIEHYILADSVAESLSPEIGVPVDQLREPLVRALGRSWVARTIINCVPLIVLNGYLLVRVIKNPDTRTRASTDTQ